MPTRVPTLPLSGVKAGPFRTYYEHKPLPRKNPNSISETDSTKPIRLLNLLPGPFENTIFGELIIYWLPVIDEPIVDEEDSEPSFTPTQPAKEYELDVHPYEALSYHWGPIPKTPQHFINILEGNKSCVFGITRNLESALRHLRPEHQTRCLWIDAVCIHQDDEAEKSEQLPFMNQIYSRAKNVCVWLGEESETSSVAFEHIKEVLNLRKFDQTVREDKADAWYALSELMKREWFSRRWVVQEIAFARTASVHCGKESIDWTQMADAVALFGSRAHDIAKLFRRHQRYDHRPDFLGDIEALGANRLVETISKLFRRADSGKKVERLMSLEALISNLSAFKASNPHDVVYAVLSLANDVITSAKPLDVHEDGEMPTFTVDDFDADETVINEEEQMMSTSSFLDPVINGDHHGNIVRGRRHSIAATNPPRRSSRPGREAVIVPNRRLSITTPTMNEMLEVANIDDEKPTTPGQELSAFHFMSKFPTEEGAAIEEILRAGYKREHVLKAVRQVRAHRQGLIAGWEYHQICSVVEKALGADGVVQECFWDKGMKHALGKKNGVAIVALKLLQQDPDARRFQLQKAVIDVLQHRVKVKTFHVDYRNKRFFDVCKEFIQLTIRSSNSLDMLCRPWAPAKEDLPRDYDHELPSWVCRLDKSPFRPRPDGNYGRVNADLLVGMPDSSGRAYGASAMTKPDACEFGTGSSSRSLYVYGFILDDIGELKVQAIEGNVPNEWLELSDPWEEKNEEPPESFWRTLVADRDDKGHNPPWYYRRACQHAFAQRVVGGSLNTERMMISESSKIMTDYLRRVQSVVWNRRLMKTLAGRRLGLVPHDAREGDMICIVRGCSVPVVLRKIKDDQPDPISRSTTGRFSFGSSSQDRRANGTSPSLRNLREPLSPTQEKNPKVRFDVSLKCRLIGECYVHGVMDGEAFRIRDRRNLKDAEFELV